MAELSAPRKALMAAQVASRMARRSRLLAGAAAGARATLASFARVAHLLWLEITGVFFLFFALGFSGAGWREYRRHGMARPEHLWLAVAFAALFAWFGVSSFWRVGRKRSN